ncbi:glycosyltransferase family 4 protein [Geodermatophilus sp. SYSU D00815]
MTALPAPGRPRLAYLVSQYPEISHAFIETEIEAVRALGAEVHTFSAREPEPADLVTERSREEARRTAVLQRAVVPTLLRASLALLRRSPAALGAGLALALRSGPRTLRARAMQVFYLGEAVVLWWRMSRLGLRHVHVHFANNGADIARLAVAVGTAADGPDAGWAWSLAMHGPTEFEDVSRYDLPAKLASAARVACITDFCRSQVLRSLPSEQWGKAGLVRMGVDTRRFSPAPAADRPPGAPLRVLSVGRLVPEKGAPLLLDAVARLVAAGTPVHLTLVGGGPLHDLLAAEIRARGLDDAVELAGPRGQEELPDLYRASDAFCLPSFAEGLPVVLMEAMASGLPVVTTTIAGIPELVVHRGTGLLVAPGRADLIAAALSELAEDRALGRALGEAGRAAVVALHDPAVNARALIDLVTDGRSSL